MQLRHARIGALVALSACALGPGWALAESTVEDSRAGSLLRLFTDSDHVAVRSWTGDYTLPLRNSMVSLHWNNERVVIPAVDAPVGSAEAIDAITTASRPISGNAYQDYIKVRNELQGGLARGDMNLGYYYSKESDYLAQQVSGAWHRDLAGDQLNLSFGTSYGWDAIEPAQDDDTQAADDSKTTLHVNTVATRILSPTTMVRLGVEYNRVSGLQHNPYRRVYAAGTYVTERHPDQRGRGDVFFKVNQYLSQRSSLKLGYRLYGDDWGIVSHEIDSKLTQYVKRGISARYEYRYYTQNAADFYRDEYLAVDGVDGYRSGDYRMADLSSHLFGAMFDVELEALAGDRAWLSPWMLWIKYERYFNNNNYSANILETGLEFRFQ